MLHLHRAARADALVPPLAALLAAAPEDPFSPEVLAVPTRGVERWLAQRLSHHLGAGPHEPGVCANVRFEDPARLVAGALRRVRADGVDADPWQRESLTWTVLRVLDESRDRPWAAPVDRFLGIRSEGGTGEGGLDPAARRWSLAARITDRFLAYAHQRPELTLAWSRGEDHDGTGAPVPADLGWQPPLWRALRAAIEEPDPSQRLLADLELIAAGAEVGLPARVGVFGATRLPTTTLRVLATLAVQRDVHLWLIHPSPTLWARTAELWSTGALPVRRAGRPSPAQHPLLASMAGDTVDLQGCLMDVADPSGGGGPGATDCEHPATDRAPTLLGGVQARMVADDPHLPVPAGALQDRSVQVHACHGPARQVEVLRDVLAGLFADDPTLQPRDVLVMCPDVERFAPLVGAVFGPADDAGEHHPGRDLRVQVADRSLRRTNPCLDLLATLLDLAGGRVRASEVLDLAADPPVRARFGFDDEELEQVRAWAVEAGAHWGEDERRRARYGLGHVRQGTWDAVTDRLLLGVAMAEEDHRFLGSALPLDDVPAPSADLAGRWAEFLERLADVLGRLQGTHPAAEWLVALEDALELLAATPRAEEWQLVQAHGVLDRVRREAGEQLGRDLGLADVHALLADRLKGRPTRAGFRTGALTVCSLEPMRAVPHRVICLLGMDDGVFPRGGTPDGVDLLRRDPWRGERDRRSEDRQLFLDAVMSATDTLVVLYTGADERTGARRPPAVPVAELLDALPPRVAGGPGAPVVVHHPLQPTAARTFTPGALGRRGPFGFDPLGYRGAVAATGVRQASAPTLGAPLPPARTDSVELDDLVAALSHPARWFLRQQAQVRLGRDVAQVSDRLPLDADPLTLWAAGDRLLRARLAGEDPQRARQAEWRRGQLPPRWWAAAALQTVERRLEPIALAAAGWAGAPETSVDVTADLPQGIPVLGTVTGVRELDVATLTRAVYSRLAGKHRLSAWVQLLALACTYPDRQWRAVTIGRARASRDLAAVSELTAPSAPIAASRLQDLLLLRERCARVPLPLPVSAAAAYAAARAGGTPEPAALDDARRAWADARDDVDPEWELCWPTGGRFERLLVPPTREEAAWAARLAETSRFAVLARRVWEPLLEAERRWTA